MDTYASVITKHGRRVVTVSVEAWQERSIATDRPCGTHFLSQIRPDYMRAPAPLPCGWGACGIGTVSPGRFTLGIRCWRSSSRSRPRRARATTTRAQPNSRAVRRRSVRSSRRMAQQRRRRGCQPDPRSVRPASFLSLRALTQRGAATGVHGRRTSCHAPAATSA